VCCGVNLQVETNKAVPRDDQQTMNRQTGSIHGLDAPKRFLLEVYHEQSHKLMLRSTLISLVQLLML